MKGPDEDDLKAFGFDPVAGGCSCRTCGLTYVSPLGFGPRCIACRSCATAFWEKAMAEAAEPKPADHTGLWLFDVSDYDWVFDDTDAAKGIWGTRRALVVVSRVGRRTDDDGLRHFISERAVTLTEIEGNDPDDRLGAACRDTWAEASRQALTFINEQNSGGQS